LKFNAPVELIRSVLLYNDREVDNFDESGIILGNKGAKMMLSSMNYPPSHGDLINEELNYLKEKHPQDYNGMSFQKRSKYAEEVANRAEGCAKNLLAKGKPKNEAWDTAIRQEILGKDKD